MFPGVRHASWKALGMLPGKHPRNVPISPPPMQAQEPSGQKGGRSRQAQHACSRTKPSLDPNLGVPPSGRPARTKPGRPALRASCPNQTWASRPPGVRPCGRSLKVMYRWAYHPPFGASTHTRLQTHWMRLSLHCARARRAPCREAQRPLLVWTQDARSTMYGWVGGQESARAETAARRSVALMRVRRYSSGGGRSATWPCLARFPLSDPLSLCHAVSSLVPHLTDIQCIASYAF